MCIGHLAHPRPFSREQWRAGEGDRANGEINGLTTFKLDITGMDLATLKKLSGRFFHRASRQSES